MASCRQRVYNVMTTSGTAIPMLSVFGGHMLSRGNTFGAVDSGANYAAGFAAGLAAGSGAMLSLTPADGSLLSEDPEIARFTPIVSVIKCGTGNVPYVFVTIGSLRWTIYDGTEDGGTIAPFFADHTTVTPLGDNTFSISVLPNGGWWRSGIDVHFVSGLELIL